MNMNEVNIDLLFTSLIIPEVNINKH